MGNRDTGSEEGLAAWLQEVAKRPWPKSGFRAPRTSPGSPESSDELLGYLESLAGRRLRSREEVRRFVADSALPESQAWRGRVRRSIARQSAVLTMLAVAVLQFYFLDVSLKIQSLNSVGAFVPAASSPKLRT